MIALALGIGAFYAVGRLSFTAMDRSGAPDPIAAAKLQMAAQIVAGLVVYRVVSK